MEFLVGPPSHSGDVRHWEQRHGFEGEAFTAFDHEPGMFYSGARVADWVAAAQ
jgi:hypothetical protein